MTKRLGFLVSLCLLLPSLAVAIPAIVFDTNPGGAGGTLIYDGAGGPAIGTDIVFVNLSGVDTPANTGVTLACVNCALDFTTGLNIQEGPGLLWIWEGGGNFTLTGDIPALGLTGAILLSGTFTGTPNTPGLAGTDPNALFIALGTDTKDSTLASFYGLGPDFIFGNTEIALGTFSSDPATGAFTSVPNQADIVNVAQVVPTPMTLLLIGVGMGGLVAVRRKGR
jgi:hypothetical protein